MINFPPSSSPVSVHPFFHTLLIPAPRVTRLYLPPAPQGGGDNLCRGTRTCFAQLWVKTLSKQGCEVEGSLQLHELLPNCLGWWLVAATRDPAWPEICLELEMRCVCPQHENKQDLGSGAADALSGREPRPLAQRRRDLGPVFSSRRRKVERGRFGSRREGQIPPLQGWERGLKYQVAWQWL